MPGTNLSRALVYRSTVVRHRFALKRPSTPARAGRRASGLPYTIVRPGWFDYNAPDEHRLVLLQGDKRQAGDPSDGAVARCQIAEVLVRSLSAAQALHKTFELVATTGPAPDDFGALFAPLDADPPGALDGVHDAANMPLEEEPQRVRDDLDAVLARAVQPPPEGPSARTNNQK